MTAGITDAAHVVHPATVMGLLPARPRLLALGFRITFRPFEGGHVLPDAIAEEAVRFFATGRVG